MHHSNKTKNNSGHTDEELLQNKRVDEVIDLDSYRNGETSMVNHVAVSAVDVVRGNFLFKNGRVQIIDLDLKTLNVHQTQYS